MLPLLGRLSNVSCFCWQGSASVVVAISSGNALLLPQVKADVLPYCWHEKASWLFLVPPPAMLQQYAVVVATCTAAGASYAALSPAHCESADSIHACGGGYLYYMYRRMWATC